MIHQLQFTMSDHHLSIILHTRFLVTNIMLRCIDQTPKDKCEQHLVGDGTIIRALAKYEKTQLLVLTNPL